MGLQRVFSYVAMETALAKVLGLPVLVLIVEEAVEVLDSGAIKFAGLFNQQRVDPQYLLWLLAKVWIVTPLSQPNTLMARLLCFSTFGI